MAGMLSDWITYITQAAQSRGIDPNIALKVARSEGLGEKTPWQSTFTKNGVREPSYGDFQLYTGGGLGNEFEQKTGLKASDEANRAKMIDFALDTAREKGWGPWYGAKRAGITGKMGIGAVPQTQPASAPALTPGPTPARQRFDNLIAQNGSAQPSTVGSAPDMVAEGMAAQNMPAFSENNTIGTDFLRGKGLGMKPEAPMDISPSAQGPTPGSDPDTPETMPVPTAQPGTAAPAAAGGDGNFLSRLLPGGGSTGNMGFFERLRQPGTREALMRFGAGLAGNASKGWGAGIGAGFEGAADALDTNRKMNLLEGEQGLKNLGPALAYKYNISKGMNPNEALLRAVKPEMFGEWDVVQTGETPAGAKIFREHNKTTGEWRDPPNAQPDNAQSEAEGPDLLKSIEDPNDRKIVEKLSTYDWNPADISIRGKHPRSWYMGMAQRVNPGLDVTNYPSRFAAKKEFMTGTGANSPANVITMGNTAIKHLGEMSDEAEKLDNFNTGIPGNALLNYGRNEYKKASGTATDLSAFEAAREKYVDEATKFYRGTGGNESDILRGIELLSSSKSLPELRSAVNENVKLMQSKIDALQDRWHQAVPGAGDFPIVHEDAQGALDRIGRRFQNLQGPADVGVTPPAPPAPPEQLPAGIDPEDWKYMSADQRKLFGAQ